MHRCPQCKGSGKITVTVNVWGSHQTKNEMNCITCRGKKEITEKQHGDYLKERNMWCKCGNPSNKLKHTFVDNDIYLCVDCNKVRQTG